MGSDLGSRVVIDPTLERLSVVAQAVRFLRKELVGDDYRFEFAAALRLEGKRWPKGTYVLQAYGDDGVIADSVRVDTHKTLDSAVIQLQAAFYVPSVATAELIFQPKVERDADSWEKVDVEIDDSEAAMLGVKLTRFRAESHDDFGASNLTLIHVRGRVSVLNGLPFPDGLKAQLTVLNSEDDVLSTSYVDLGYGPTEKRTLDAEVQIYRHHEADRVEVAVYTV